jgi:hypothetical protein
MELLVLPEHKINPLNMCDFIGFELGVASGNDENRVRVLSPDTMNHLPVFMIGSIGHGAGVDDADIRLFAFLSTRMSACYQGLT